MRPVIFENNPMFWFETLRSFGHIAYGGADFGEVLVTAQRIVEGDETSWHDEWRAIADRVADHAARSLATGHVIGARDGFLRASNYYRSAEFFLHDDPSDTRAHSSYAESIACFRRAIALFETPVEPVDIPYERTKLPGYLYAAGSAPGPTVIVHSGFDGTAEELHFVIAAALAEQGFRVLTFDGPGQPGPMHREGLVFRPDWENVVGPVVDYAMTRPEVDPDAIALLGVSMGGVLASRATAFEPRIAALVALDGVYDMAAIATRAFDVDREVAKSLVSKDDPELSRQIGEFAAGDPQARWAITHGMWVTGSPTPRDYIRSMFDYHVGDGIAERIACPALVCSAPDDFAMQGQPEELYAHLTCPKTFLEFDGQDGADAHCQAGAQRLAGARIGEWLDHTLKGNS